MISFILSYPELKNLYHQYSIQNHPLSLNSPKDFIFNCKQAQDLWEREVLLNPDHNYNIEKFLLTNERAKKLVLTQNGAPHEIINRDPKLRLEYQVFFRSLINTSNKLISLTQGGVESGVPPVSNKPLDEVLSQQSNNNEDQEYVEEFLLSNRELRDSFVEAKRLDDSLTPEKFLKQAGASINRQFKKQQINLHRKSIINNFLLSNQNVKMKYEYLKKNNPNLTEEEFLKNNKDVLVEYHDFVKKIETDKVVDKFLKQNRDVENLFIHYQRQTGQNDFQGFINAVPNDIKEKYSDFVLHEQKVKDLHITLDENPSLKQIFLKAKSGNRDLNDIQLLERDSVLRGEVEEANSNKIQEEIAFSNYVLDAPEIMKEYENFKSVNVNAGMKQFLDYNPDILNEFNLYYKNEEKLKQEFKMTLLNDPQINKAFDQFVTNSKQNNQKLQKLVESHPKFKSILDEFLTNNETSMVSYASYIRSNPILKRQYETEKAKNNNLTYKDFVEKSKTTKAQYNNFLTEGLKNDNTLIDSFFRANPHVKSEILNVINKDPTFLYKEFLSSNKNAQMKYKDQINQSKSGTSKKISLMAVFLKNSKVSSNKFEQFKKSSKLQENKNIFKAFINNDPTRRSQFVDFLNNDNEIKKLFVEVKKKNPTITFEEFARVNLFQNVQLNKKFLNSSKQHMEEFDRFIKEDDSVIREFVNSNQDVKKDMTKFINSNQKAKLEYEVFIKQNPMSEITLEEYLTENPNLIQEEHKEDVYNAFLNENKEIFQAFLDVVNKNPNQEISVKEFVQNNEKYQKEFTQFATDEVVIELKNIEDFANSSKEVQSLIPKYIEQNEEEALNILFLNPDIRKEINAAKKNNPNASLATILNKNENLKQMCIEQIKEDKGIVRKIIKNNINLKTNYIGFVDEKLKQEHDFELFIKDNPQVKQIFNNMKRENSNLTFDGFLKEAKKNTMIKDMYVRDTLYNPDNNLTYEKYLLSDSEIRNEYQKYVKNQANPNIEFSKYVDKIKNDRKNIEKYRKFVEKNPTQKNFVREFIDNDSEAKNKFHQFVRQFVEEEANYIKFVQSNNEIKEGWNIFQIKNPKASMKDYVNNSAIVKAKYVTFIKDHPETFEKFVKTDTEINQNYKEFLIKARDDAHFVEFLNISPEVRKEYEALLLKNPKSKLKFDEFVTEYKQKEVARQLYEKQKTNSTREAISIAIKNKQDNSNLQPVPSYQFKDSLYSLTNIEGRQEEEPNENKPDSPVEFSKKEIIKNEKIGMNFTQDINDQSSVGSNVLNSPMTGLGADYSDYNRNIHGGSEYNRGRDLDGRIKLNNSDRSRLVFIKDINKKVSDNQVNKLEQNISDTKLLYGERDRNSKIVFNLVDNQSPNSSFVSGNQKMGTYGYEERKEDDWEKLSRISKRTSQNKKPVNLDSFEDKIRTLHNLHLDIGKNTNQNSRLYLMKDKDKDKTHSQFLGQKVPLSERNQGETDSNSASNNPPKRVSIFVDLQNQPIRNKEDLLKFLKDHQERKRESVGGKESSLQEQSLTQNKEDDSIVTGKLEKTSGIEIKRKGSDHFNKERQKEQANTNQPLTKRDSLNAPKKVDMGAEAVQKQTTADTTLNTNGSKGKIFNSKSQASLSIQQKTDKIKNTTQVRPGISTINLNPKAITTEARGKVLPKK